LNPVAASKSVLKIALVGNPNSGKSSLFNELTGMHQKVGNYPGVTVDKKTGAFKVSDNGVAQQVKIIDLPGAYSLSPRSEDEKITASIITDKQNPDHPDVAVFVADSTNLKRSLLLCTQLIDLGIPTILALNMTDVAELNGLSIDHVRLEGKLGIKVVPINARKAAGIDKLKLALLQTTTPSNRIFSTNVEGPNSQPEDIIQRYKAIDDILALTTSGSDTTQPSTTEKLDRILVHKIWGFVIFLGILLLIFQAIFSWAESPMNWIDAGFAQLGDWLTTLLPEGSLRDLLINGVLAGLAGIMIFIPQIAFLFLSISIMEDTGYMARVSFIMDRLMRKFGLSGRSVVPLVSGVACAIPAVMSARSIPNWKERMITIMVTPLMTCSARLPVYILIISLVIPQQKLFGVINMQAMVLMGMYLIGFLGAIGTAWALKFVLRSKESSFFMMEMPIYRPPRWKNIGLTIYEKVKVFVIDAGKVIIAISIILWALASYGPGDRFEEIDSKYESEQMQSSYDQLTLSNMQAAEKLEASYAGTFGKAIEPIIEPLGFDWKIGIALITSFAAREVFVGTMATIYSLGSEGDTKTIKERMASETRPGSDEKVYSLAVGLSLMIFYAFAMQCMSTLAIVLRETKHWKWPLVQMVYMTGLAYLASLLVYQLFK